MSSRPARWLPRCWGCIARSRARIAGFVFVVGIDEEGQTGRAVCPNCGQRGLDDTPAIECGGDRVLVQKFLYDFRRPKRWEVAVFHFPGEPSQAYVKRVVGLPGESIRIVGGDIFVDGKIVRKSLPEIRAMRMLVHDSRFQPQDAKAFRAGNLDRGRGDRVARERLDRSKTASSPTPASVTKLGRVPTGSSTNTGIPSAGRYGPVRDFYGYNGGDLRADNDVARPGDRGTAVRERRRRCDLGGDSVGLRSVCRAEFRSARRGSIELLRNNQPKRADKLPESF